MYKLPHHEISYMNGYNFYKISFNGKITEIINDRVSSDEEIIKQEVTLKTNLEYFENISFSIPIPKNKAKRGFNIDDNFKLVIRASLTEKPEVKLLFSDLKLIHSGFQQTLKNISLDESIINEKNLHILYSIIVHR